MGFAIIGTVISGLAKVGTWGAAVAGADIITTKAREYAEGTRAEPVVAGIGDVFAGLLDPLDFSGTRKRKEEEQAAKEAKAKGQLAKSKAEEKREEKARKAAQAANKKATAKLADAQKKINAQIKKVEELRRKGDKQAAQLASQKASSAARLSALSRRYQAESAKTEVSNPDQSAQMAAAALEIAKMAMNPPQSTAQAILKEGTDAGRSAIAAILDSVNRDADPDIDALFARLNSGDSQAYDAVIDTAWESASSQPDYGDDAMTREAYLDGPVEGGEPTEEVGCGDTPCTGCASGGSCAGKTKPASSYGDRLTSGSFGWMAQGEGWPFEAKVSGYDDDDDDGGIDVSYAEEIGFGCGCG